MDRYNELMELVPADSKDLVNNTVKEIVFLEAQLDTLRELPFIRVNPDNKTQQKSTPAYKMYKEFLQQYNNCVKLVESVIYRDKRLEGEEVEESPLRAWFRSKEVNND